MTTAINSAIFPFAHPTTEPKADAIRFLDEKLASVPASDIPEHSRKLSPNKSVTDLTDTLNGCSPMDAAKTWLKNSNATDTFEFGGVKGCLSTMEISRNGGPVTLTSKELKTLAYLIRNPRRVISRDELLNEVWGYENYPCTRTVDNHILKLHKKLESEPAHFKHFHTVHCAGYTLLP
jgi:DNA-binding response OmpR family regulator